MNQNRSKIKVLIVDDSAVVRRTLTEILISDPDIEVTGTASDPYIAANKLLHDVPDVITLDIEMPRMDGLTFLKKIMSQHPIPVVIISSLTQAGTESAIKALELGAIEVAITNNVEKIKSSNSLLKTTEKVIAVGASTGGTEAIRSFLECFPADA